MYQEFIREFKELESYTRDLEEQSVFEYENTLPTEDREKLKVCRIIRNYMQHNTDSGDFVLIGKGMVDFIHELNMRFELRFTHVADKTKKIKPIGFDTTLQECASILAKYEFAPIVDKDKNIIGALDRLMFASLISEGNRLTVKIKSLLKDNEKLFARSLNGYRFASPEERLELYREKERIIVKDANGAYKGIVVW
ncbi:MAG: hypothetical protein IKG55_08700 [Solobacterium sp.]|nr:hypothetical protein [Erysipelotrichaceae bacterium]MBR3350137.1 hypothetical protein [Solobacterium sp.]